MKKLAILLLSQLMCFQAFAWRESNGGNGIEAEATSIANKLVKEMWKVPVLRKYYQYRDFEIIKSDKVTLNNAKKDAYAVTNHGDISIIFIDQDAWPLLNYEQKRGLIRHELTHIMFFVDKQYMFSEMAVQKMEKYDQLAKKYPLSDFPFEDEMIVSINKCNLPSFITSFLLVADVNYQMNETNQTIRDLILNSKCDAIKNYGPLKELL